MSNNDARYCQIFPDLVEYYPMLCNIVKYCLILFNIVQYCSSGYFSSLFLSCNSILKNVMILSNIVKNFLMLSSIACYCKVLTNIVQWHPLWKFCPWSMCVSVTNFSVKYHGILLYKPGYSNNRLLLKFYPIYHCCGPLYFTKLPILENNLKNEHSCNNEDYHKN